MIRYRMRTYRIPELIDCYLSHASEIHGLSKSELVSKAIYDLLSQDQILMKKMRQHERARQKNKLKIKQDLCGNDGLQDVSAIQRVEMSGEEYDI